VPCMPKPTASRNVLRGPTAGLAEVVSVLILL
jgi:hypothetical protein